MGILGTPSFRLTLGGLDFESNLDLKRRVIKMEVKSAADKADMFEVEIDDSDGKFFANYRSQIKLKGTAKIAFGYSGKDYQTLMDGYISQVEVRRLSREKMIVIVSGYDYLHALTEVKRRRNWFDKKDSEVATEIAQAYGMSTEMIEGSAVVHKEILQNNTTDFVFLSERATRCGFEIDCVGKKLFFGRPKKKSAVCTLIWDYSNFKAQDFPRKIVVENCDFETDTQGQIKKVVVQGYDPATNAMIEGSSSDIVLIGSGGKTGGDKSGENEDAENSTMIVTNQPVRSVEDAEKLAWSILNQQAGYFVKASGKCLGYGKVLPGEFVDLLSFGDAMDGPYVVVGTTHSFDAMGSGYTMQFELRRSQSKASD